MNSADKKKIQVNIKIWQILLCLAWLGWMILIFWFSSKPAAVSQKQSHAVGEMVCSILVNGYRKWTSARQLKEAVLIDHFVRKTAHFTEYTVFGILTYSVSRMIPEILRRGRKKTGEAGKLLQQNIRFPLLWCFLYASSDEFHQLFVPGRSGRWQDVLIDTAGALTGILIMEMLRSLRHKTKNPA